MRETFNKKAKEHFHSYDVVTYIDNKRQHLVLLNGETKIADVGFEIKNYEGYKCICNAEVNKDFRKQGIYTSMLNFLNGYVKSKGLKGICSTPFDRQTGEKRTKDATNVWRTLETKGLASSHTIKNTNDTTIKEYFMK